MVAAATLRFLVAGRAGSGRVVGLGLGRPVGLGRAARDRLAGFPVGVGG